MSKLVTNPLSIIIEKRELILQLAKRQIISRYKGSFLGLAWSLFNPILMLIVYTFVFSVVFKSHWNNDNSTSHVDFAIILFTGLITFNLFSECISQAPHLINSNVNFVKKVVFPIEILPIVSLLTAIFHFTVSLTVLIGTELVSKGTINITIILLPIIMIPFILSIVGLSWFLSSLGVFIRDIPQTINILIMILMFLSPIFYPISALPLVFQKIVMLNPIAFIIESARNVVYWGTQPDWNILLINLIISLFIFFTGFVFFQKTKKGFADVL